MAYEKMKVTDKSRLTQYCAPGGGYAIRIKEL
jgi:hypothetical protein